MKIASLLIGGVSWLGAAVTTAVRAQSVGDVSSGSALLSSLWMDLDIPAFRLDVYDGAERLRSYRVAVGMPRYPTPTGSFVIRRLTWNPWWVPPPSAWARAEKVTPPGPRNPMGKVKLEFASQYYVHGTFEEGSIGRAASHGCVRLTNADAIDLASLLQRTLATGPGADSLIARALADRRTRVIRLPSDVRVGIRYDLVELRGDTLFVYPDPYSRGGSPAVATLAVLRGAGMDSSAIDFTAVARLRRYPATALVLLVRRTMADAAR